MGRDTFHQTRLLKAPSNLGLNASGAGGSTAHYVVIKDAEILISQFMKPAI